MFQDLSVAVHYQNLPEAGVGICVKYTSIVTEEEEDLLWESKVIGDHEPLALLKEIF